MNILKLSKMRILLAFIALSFITSDCINDESISHIAKKLFSNNGYKKKESGKKINTDKNKEKPNQTDYENAQIALNQKNIAIQKKNDTEIEVKLAENAIKFKNFIKAKKHVDNAKNYSEQSHISANLSEIATNKIPTNLKLYKKSYTNTVNAKIAAEKAKFSYNKIKKNLLNADVIILAKGRKIINSKEFKQQIFKKKVQIDSSVHTIKNNAFESTIFHETLVLPNTIIKIEDSTFEKVIFHKDLIFKNNSKLKIIKNIFAETIFHGKVILADSATKIASFAFNKAIFHGKVILPPNLEYIGYLAFAETTLQAGFKIPNNVRIGRNIFTDIILPKYHRWSKDPNPKGDPNYNPVAGDEIVAIPKEHLKLFNLKE